MLVVFWSTFAFAGIALPANKAIAKVGGFVSDLNIGPQGADNKMAVAVPISLIQKGTPVLSMSIAKAVGDGWTQVSNAAQYTVATKDSAGYAIADLNLEKGVYRIRLWGKVGDDWLHINKASIYYRLDAAKRGAYEFIINMETGEVMPVPQDYPAWN